MVSKRQIDGVTRHGWYHLLGLARIICFICDANVICFTTSHSADRFFRLSLLLDSLFSGFSSLFPFRSSDIHLHWVSYSHSDAVSLEALSDSSLLSDFCSFETKRKKFCLDGIVIDLDSMDYGFAIGEMEVIVNKTGDEKHDTENHRRVGSSAKRL